MFTFHAVIWEKAEHWTFEVTIEAETEQQARAMLTKDYPARAYSIRSIQAFGPKH